MQIILGLCEALAHKKDGQVQAVFNQHHSEEDAQALAEEARAGAEHAKAVFEDLFGQPLHGADGLHTAEAVFEAGLRQYREQQQRLEDKRQAKKAKKKPAARQLKDAQQKMDANTALRTVYRQLASALHPDREPDEAERIDGAEGAVAGRNDELHAAARYPKPRPLSERRVVRAGRRARP
jgi:DnaJ-class molecular chaperone